MSLPDKIQAIKHIAVPTNNKATYKLYRSNQLLYRYVQT